MLTCVAARKKPHTNNQVDESGRGGRGGEGGVCLLACLPEHRPAEPVVVLQGCGAERVGGADPLRRGAADDGPGLRRPEDLAGAGADVGLARLAQGGAAAVALRGGGRRRSFRWGFFFVVVVISLWILCAQPPTVACKNATLLQVFKMLCFHHIFHIFFFAQ